MPGTTRYSATFDRTYEEEDRADPSPHANARRSRSLSLQTNSFHDGRLYTPLTGRPPSQRSSSQDNSPVKGPEHIPTRTAKTTVKAHNNPFQFVKVGSCPLYKKAEEQLKKVKEVKEPEVLKEEEEEWQSNLDSWKSRRRKMSEDVIRRQEEIKQLEMEEQVAQVAQKKTKTFSEMVESRATRGRALSLCLLSSPLEFKDWEFENKSHKNGSCSYTDESGENSTVNSEDEGVSVVRRRLNELSKSESNLNHRTNGDAHIEQNGTKLSTQNGHISESVQMKPKENYVDSGLESISSSHRAGDTPDSGSDFSQDSNSSTDCDSPRSGVNVLEEFTSKPHQLSGGEEIPIKLNLVEKGQDFGFTFLGGKDEGQVLIASILEGSKAESAGIHLGDKIITIDNCDVSSRKHIEIAAMLQKGREKGQINLLLWRHPKAAESTNGFTSKSKNKPKTPATLSAKPQERSIESENEMYVDDFEELERQSELMASNMKLEAISLNAQSTTSPKVNTTAKQNEDITNSNDCLNIIFQSPPKSLSSENLCSSVKSFENTSGKIALPTDLVPDVPPVEKVAEEMEKLILEQLEEEERAKELSSEMKILVGSPELLLIAPPRLAEPPKEKPPPPPSNEGSPKQETSLKRVNSTKRIKKEIYKRRSNFLGIDNVDENIACSEPSIPPPPALEEILKAEMELDRQSRLKIESESDERLTLEEKEIMEKEREIIESLESEERQKMLMNGTEDSEIVINNLTTYDVPSSVQNQVEALKSERKWLEADRQRGEEQQQILLEEKQLREREEFIRQQEATKSAAPLSNSSLSVAANTANISKPALSSLPTATQTNVSHSGANGDGKSLNLNTPEVSESGEKSKVRQKPALPPKPLKKKEAIRKERERLRQEQEALQREREEHRRKLMLEQEELVKTQKSHAPEAPVSRLGPLPPLVQPAFTPQITTTTNASPNARESASLPSRSHHGAPNGSTGSMNAVELMGPPVVRQNRLPSPRKAVQTEAWGQQKMSSVRKQNHESLPESRYNQNHWLIQEAEMRRIAELKERQRNAQLPCSQTHLAEDDVCSNPLRVPVISPTHNPHLNFAVQDKMWNYGQPIKKYPPPVVKEPPLHTVPRETVTQQAPTKPSRVVPMERQEQMLSVSGRKRCSHCNEELGRGAAMIIESLQLYYHIHCFQCCVCQAQLGNGSCGTDVRVRNNKLHCHNCYSNDEAGLKFSQV